MKKIRLALVAAVLALGSVVVLAPPARAGCNDCPGNCGVDVVVAGKRIAHIDCA